MKKSLEVTRNLVPLTSIEIQPDWNHRSNTTPEPEFVASVRAVGIKNPIHVRWRNKDSSRIYIVDGERRYNAAKAAGHIQVPITHHGDLSDEKARVIALTTNLYQKPYPKRDMMKAIAALRVDGLSVVKIAKIMGKSKSSVHEIMQAKKATNRISKQVGKPKKEGGIVPSVAARASTLSVRKQRSIAPELKGKTEKQGLTVVKEAKMGPRIKLYEPAAPAPAPQQEYLLAPDYKERVKKMEELIRDKLHFNPRQKYYLGQLAVINVIKGRLKPMDIFSP